MRSIVIALALCVGSSAWADAARSEMTAALVAQADLHPTPVSLPKTAVAPRHAVATSAVKRGVVARSADNARTAANNIERRTPSTLQALVRQAQAATFAAAGQAQAQAAKDRARRNPPPQRR